MIIFLQHLVDTKIMLTFFCILVGLAYIKMIYKETFPN